MILKYRFEHYESKDALFNLLSEEVIQLYLNERFYGMFIEMIRFIEVLFDGLVGLEILEKILHDEKTFEIISKLIKNDSDVKCSTVVNGNSKTLTNSYITYKQKSYKVDLS